MTSLFEFSKWMRYVFCFYLLIIPLSSLSGQWNIEHLGEGAGGKLTVDSTGGVHLCYLSDSFEGNLIHARRDGDQWVEEILDNSSQVTQCVIATGNTNELYIAYVTSNWNTNTHTLQFLSNDGTGWSSPETITSNNIGITSLSIDVDLEGFLHLGYIRSYGGASNGPLIYYTNRSGTWEQSVISQLYEEYPYGSAAMAVDANGHTHFAFYNMPGGPAYQTNAPDGEWSDVISIQDNWTGGQMESMDIGISLDSEGIPHVSYVGSDNGEPYENHRYATRTGADWVTEQVDDGSEYSGANAIAVDPNGNSHITYYHMATDELRYASSTEAWSHETLDVCESTEGSLDMVVDSEGYAHICYQEDPEHISYATNHVEEPAPQIALSPENLSFGTIDTGEVATDSLYIKNYGVLDLHISDIQLTGGNLDEFSLDHSCDTIVPDDSCKVKITFHPDYIGEKQTTLAIESDDPDAPVFTTTISGRTPYPVITTDPVDLEFESIDVGGIDSLNLTIANDGDANLMIDSLRITGDGADAFSYRASCTTIAPSTSCELRLFFKSEQPGMHTAMLYLYSNDPYNPAETISLLARTPSAHINVQTDILDFGTVPEGNMASEQMVIENTGERQLNISGVTISGMNASQFGASNTCGIISAGGSCVIQLTFHPQSTGLKSSSLIITSNDPDQPEYTVNLQGTGGKIRNGSFTYGPVTDSQTTRFWGLDTVSSGETLVCGQVGHRAYLAGISANGDILWEEGYQPDEGSGCIRVARETWDGGYITAGVSGGKRWIARIDHDREIIWQKKVEEERAGRINDVHVTSDSGFIACGWTKPDIPHYPDRSDIWVGKFDSSGSLLWQKRLGESSEDEAASGVLEMVSGDFLFAFGGFYCIENHPNGGYLIGGDSEGGFIRFDTNGELIWQKKGTDSIVGYNDFCIIYINDSGNALWQYKYPQPDIFERISDIYLSATNHIYTLGTAERYDMDGNPYENMRIMEVSATGKIIWQKEYTAPTKQSSEGLMVNSHGAIVAAGSYQDVVNDTEGWLCMLGTEGHLDGCSSGNLINSNASRENTNQTFDNSTLPIITPSDNFIDGSMILSVVEIAKKTVCTGIPEDIDYDGVDDTEEAGPEGINSNYDGNEDGLPDSQQDNVASLHTNDGTGYITIATDPGTHLEDVSAEENPSPEDQPDDFDFPLGFFNFTITGIDTGGSAGVDFILPEGSAPLTYYKYAITADSAVAHWYKFLYDGTVGADISGNRISLHFTDGLLGDEDTTANAVIVDIGGPGILASTLDVPSLSTPANGATNVTSISDYEWNQVVDPSSESLWYHLQVATDSLFASMVCNRDSISEDHYPMENLTAGSTYYWRVRSETPTDTSDWSGVWSFTTRVPDDYVLHQNYPNPFLQSTTIRFSVPDESHIRITIYDLRGSLCEVLTDKNYPTGDHEIEWTPDFYANGVYFYRMEAGAFQETKKLVILK